MSSVFLSHSSKDKFVVRQLADRLKEAGARVWIDEAELNIGDSLVEKIGQGIHDAKFFAVVLSHNSVASPWVQKELEIALQKELKTKRVVVLPILIEPVEVPPFLSTKLHANFTDSARFDEELAKLLRAIGLGEKRAKGRAGGKKKGAAADRDVPTQEASSAKDTSSRSSEPTHHEASAHMRRFRAGDIEIVGIDQRRTHNPDKSRVLYKIYLQLSGTPSSEWVQIFDAERHFPRHSMWREAWVEGGYIVVHCPLDELEKYHRNDLLTDVANTNTKYRDYQQRLTQQRDQEAKAIAAERDAVANLAGRVKF